MITILCVIGTRPEAIKMAPVVKALEAYPGRIRPLVCLTGQHEHIVDHVVDALGLRRDFRLQVMTADQSLGSVTASLFSKLDAVVGRVLPDWVLAQGDTMSAMVASLIAFFRRIKFGHVEAGLRTGDRWNPFPEEVNRRIADLVSSVFFAPTQGAYEELTRGGAKPSDILVTGNTVVDAQREVSSLPFDWARSPVGGISSSGRIVLVTTHRRESFGAPLEGILRGVKRLCHAYSEAGVQFAFPVHPNPSVVCTVERLLTGCCNLHLLPPLDYLCFTNLLKRSELVLTDSGGVQEEAPTFGVPVLVLRGKTERPEGLAAGVAKLVGTDEDAIVNSASAVLDGRATWFQGLAGNPYGDGRAAERIAQYFYEVSRVAEAGQNHAVEGSCRQGQGGGRDPRCAV